MAKERLRFEINSKESGKRIDKFLTDALSGRFSRVFVKKLISASSVRLNDNTVKPSHRILEGDSLEVMVPEPEKSEVLPEKIPLDIVYEDKDLLVVNKPVGMVVHPAPGNYTGTLVNALLGYCRDLSGIGGVQKPGIVHRIDKGTSGLLVVAKTDMAHRELAKQFKAKSASRVYIALVKGVMQLDNGIVDLPIGRSDRDRKKMAVDFDSEKYAVTNYKVLERYKDSTLIEAVLGTGRTHQIRVHLAYIEHPVLGDDKYGSRDGYSRPMLHAKTIGFVHPTTKEYMEFSSQLPADMKKAVSKKRKEMAG